MTVVSKNVYFDMLDDIVNKYNNTAHRSITMKPIDVTSDSYAKCNKDSDGKDSKSKDGHYVWISKYKSIFTLKIGQKKFLLLVKLKIQLLVHMWLVAWMVEKLLEVFTKKNCKILNLE